MKTPKPALLIRAFPAYGTPEKVTFEPCTVLRLDSQQKNALVQTPAGQIWVSTENLASSTHRLAEKLDTLGAAMLRAQAITTTGAARSAELPSTYFPAMLAAAGI